MSEDRPYLISRVFESTSEQESNFNNLAYNFHESLDSKERVLNEELEEEEEREDRGKREKSRQQPDIPDIRDTKWPLDINSDDHRSDVAYSDPNIFDRLTWDSAIRSGEVYQLRRHQGITEHWVYFSCNILEWEAYDPYRGRWITVPKMPPSPTESFLSSDKESLAVGTELLVFGREVNSQKVHSYTVVRYSILTNSWSPGVVMNSPRCLFGSASLGGKAIVAGGTNGRTALRSAELYNSVTQTWETLPAMNSERKMCSAVFMDGKFYVIGGKNSDNKVLKCGEEYDLKRCSWRLIPGMSAGLNGANDAPPLLAVVNNELYAAHCADKEVMKYNKENNTWATLGKLPEKLVSVNGWGLGFRACGEQLIVIGGQSGSPGGMIEINSWIPNGGPPQWNVLASKHSGGFVYSCVVMGC